MYSIHRSDRYRIRSDRMGGLEIGRMDAPRSVYLQPGDDAATVQFRIDRIDACFQAHEIDAALDRLCEEYESVMQEDVDA